MGMALVAISASYGAGGSIIGPAVADQLGVPFVDRAIPLQVAERLDVPVDDVAAHDEQGTGAGWLERMLRGFIGLETGAPAPLPTETFSSEDFHRATEQVLTRQAATGEGVILGRGAVIVLAGDPRALRVRLSGPPERRVAQAVRNQGVERATAEQALRRLDRAHAEYMRQFYGVDVDDANLYHLTLDSTAIELDTCIEMIVRAARALVSEGATA
jgi:cytidylate kinase